MRRKSIMTACVLVMTLLLCTSCFPFSVETTVESVISTLLPSESVLTEKDLADILAAMTNYTVNVVAIEEGETWLDETYSVVGNACKFSYTDNYGDSYTEYFTVTNGEMRYYADYVAVHGVYYIISDTENCLSEFEYASYHGFSMLDPNVFTEENGVYSYSGTLVNAMCKAFLDDTDSAEGGKETFKSIKIYTENDLITKITVLSDYEDYTQGETYADSYTLTYSAIGETAFFQLPANTETVTDENYNDLFGGTDDNWDDDNSSDSSEDSDDDNNDGENDRQYDYLYVGIPSEGDVNALVLPVQFENDPFTSKELKDIALAFNGNKSDTGWVSVSEFYKTASYGKLNISYTVADHYTANMTSDELLTAYSQYYSDYESNYAELDPIEKLIDEILAAYDGKYDYADYDINDDGVIDALYLVYSAPIVYDTTGDWDEELWWSWQTYTRSDTAVDGVYPCHFVWSGVEALYEETYSLKLNTTTWVHETGHLLGLEDYYDTDPEKGPAGGIGGGDMMDNAMGDHGALSKLLLGWVEPTVLTSGKQNIIIGGLLDTGDCIVIRKDSGENDFYGEYILIDLYLPTGINAPGAGVSGNPSKALVRIYHVNAEFFSAEDEEGFTYGGFVYNNGTTDIKLVKLLEQDCDDSIEREDIFAEDSDYYAAGDSLPSEYTWFDGSDFGFTVNVKSIQNGKATIEVNFE